MTYRDYKREMHKRAYDLNDLSHPDNLTGNMVAGGVLGGTAAFTLARLLKLKALGTTGMTLGGVGLGAGAGYMGTDKWVKGKKVIELLARAGESAAKRMEGKQYNTFGQTLKAPADYIDAFDQEARALGPEFRSLGIDTGTSWGLDRVIPRRGYRLDADMQELINPD